MCPRSAVLKLFACALAVSAAARAEEQVIYGPDGAPTVVQRKLYTMTGRTEVGLAGVTALNTALVDHYGGVLSVTYHPNEWFDAGVDLMGNYAGISTLGKNIRADLFSPRASQPHKDEFANDNQVKGGVFAMARLAPIYGKLNLASELKLHFQAFILGGVGAMLVHRESVNLCATPGTSPIANCTDFQSSDNVPITGEIGGGFRFYISDRWSLRTEVRAFLFKSSYKADNDLVVPTSGTDKGYLAAVTMVLVGLSRTF